MIEEDIKYLSQFEKNFKTAIYSNYSRNILESQLRKMCEIYESETGLKCNLCMHCSAAVLGFLKDLGKIYFEIVQKGNEPELNINELEKSVTELEVNTKNKKKKNMKNAKYTTK